MYGIYAYIGVVWGEGRIEPLPLADGGSSSHLRELHPGVREIRLPDQKKWISVPLVNRGLMSPGIESECFLDG